MLLLMGSEALWLWLSARGWAPKLSQVAPVTSKNMYSLIVVCLRVFEVEIT